MSIKSELICTFCSRILSSPIHLPCNCETICAEHLSEPNVVKGKTLKCKSCNQIFEIEDKEFKPNKLAQNLLSKEIYLIGEEKSLKNSLKESIQSFFSLLFQLEQDKSLAILDGYNHFQEIRRKIDLQREELKDQIDKISLDMVDRVKAIEAAYKSDFESINYKGKDLKNLDEEIKKLNEQFRDPNLLIKSLMEMQTVQKEAVSSMNSMLNEINKKRRN
jgi:hypothetical protein